MVTNIELKRNNLHCIKMDNNTITIDFSNYVKDNKGTELSNDDINEIINALNKKKYLNFIWRTSSSVRYETSFIDYKIKTVEELNDNSLPEHFIEIERQYWSAFLRGIIFHSIRLILK